MLSPPHGSRIRGTLRSIGMDSPPALSPRATYTDRKRVKIAKRFCTKKDANINREAMEKEEGTRIRKQTMQVKAYGEKREPSISEQIKDIKI